MKQYIGKGTLFIIALLLSFTSVFSQNLTRTEFTIVNDRTISLGASASDTNSSAIVAIEGDSLGFVIEASADSVSGSIRIQYLSPGQYNDTTTFAYYATAVTLPINGKAAFSDKITHLCTQQWARIWLISKNNKTTTQSIRVKAYRVRRR